MRIKSSSLRHQVQEGFEQHQNQSQSFIQLTQQLSPGYQIPQPKNKKNKSMTSKQQQAKLRFISIDRENTNLSHYKYLKQQQQKSIHKSLTLHKQQALFFNVKKKNKVLHPSNKLVPLQIFKNSVIRLKRPQIGENLQLKQYNSQEVRSIKQQLLAKGASMVFEDKREANSHALFKKLLKVKDSDSFLKSKYNSAILQKINDSFIDPKNDVPTKLNTSITKKPLQFISDFESSNLDFVTQINPFQYDLFVKADTNTLGHQNWFYFKLFNNSQEKRVVFLNICNLKRGFRMVKNGQKIQYRIRKNNQAQSTQNEQEWSQWQKIQQQVTVSISQQNPQTQNKAKTKRTYKLSFSATLSPQSQYQFSLLPPFTYSQMLQQIQTIEQGSKYVQVQILTYSLLGLAIPLITFTKKDSLNMKKNVILISSRIHPGQTCASFVSSGIIKKLSQQTPENEQLLSNCVIKVIPMLNPDGVVLGNFRTNYLGNDLNRSFNQENWINFPEIIGLKQLGRKLKQQFKEKFLCFLDLHGHSSQKNIFVYGPNYDQSHKNYLNSRFLPKTLSFLNEQFDYEKCTFALEQCKTNTARGFFINSLKVMAFTIQSSYALYDNTSKKTMKNIDLKAQNWVNFGRNVVNAIQVWIKSIDLKYSGLKNEGITKIQATQNSKQQDQFSKSKSHDLTVIEKVRKQIRKQSILMRKKSKKRKNSQNHDDSWAQDTDGQSQSQDIPFRQRQKLQKRLIESNSMHLFPRILRPAIIHPQVTLLAPLFSVTKISSMSGKSNSVSNSIVNVKHKRNRYQNIKPVNVNSAYTQYLLKQVKGLESLRPSINLMKLERKENSLIQSSNSISIK